MKLIELHCNGNPFSLNVDYIVSVLKRDEESEVYMVGDMLNEGYKPDESYEEVLRLIKEATNGNEA